MDNITPFMIASTLVTAFFVGIILYGLKHEEKRKKHNCKDHNNPA